MMNLIPIYNDTDSDTGEEFVVFDVFPNYLVSSYGRVMNITTDRELKPRPHHIKGYLKIALHHGGKRFEILLARLVAKAFLPDYEPGYRVSYIDGDITNCRADNLELTTPSKETLW